MTRSAATVLGGLVVGLLAVAGNAPDEPKPKPPPAVRSAECRWAQQPIKIDGILNDAAGPVVIRVSRRWAASAWSRPSSSAAP